MQFIKYACSNRSNRTFVLKCLLYITVFLTLVQSVSNTCFAVTSKITRHNTYDYFSKGQTDSVIIDSKGSIKLGFSAETIVKDFTKTAISGDYDPWSINSIVVSPRAIYIGTSPNGGIYKYSMNQLSKIYPIASEKEREEQKAESEENQEEKDKSDAAEAKEHLTNEHIFAMATDVSGRLLAGISGKECKLLRFEKDKPVNIFEPEPQEAKYIFAISVVENGNIYLGTGPEGKIYRLGPSGQKPTIVFDSKDKNILSLAIGSDGFLYAGTDTRGLVYQINTETKTAKVLYDSEQAEIASLLFSKLQDKPYIYAAGTSAQIAKTEVKFATSQPLAGRPEDPESSESPTESKGGLNLKIPNTKRGTSDKDEKSKKAPSKPPKPSEASFIYQIDKKGYVTDIFTEKAVLFAIAKQQEKLLVGTGNTGALFQIDPATEEKAAIYEDKQASQITAVTTDGQEIYVGTANPAKFIKLTSDFSSEGTYISDLIDSGQPTKWGKLQLEANIPSECQVLMSCRSGNVKDVNDPTFSDWTKPVKITGPMQMECPIGRFSQYKLILKSKDGKSSPVVREVVVANTIPNLRPVVEAVSVGRIEGAGKEGFFKISYKSKDGNDDKLIYNIDFRKLGRTGWIELDEKNDKDSFEWDSKTVEDGRYEIRVTASDERSNTPATALTGSRISDPAVVDNTGPVIESREKAQVAAKTILKLKTTDEFSAIEKVEYTVDSNADWKSTVPVDLVFDTMEEDVDIVIEELQAGEHVIAVKAVDVVGNTTYRSFEINLLK
ncbi:MAG: flagellar hook assembly protein FlgD [Planctomycetota bacterium]|jgi:hypothetical protein